MGPFDRFNDRAKRVLALAQDEAIRFNHNYIGVVREGQSIGAGVLQSLGVSLDQVRHQVIATLGQQHSWRGGSEVVQTPMRPADFVAMSSFAIPLDRLDGASRRALARAYWEAGRTNEEE